MLPVKRFRLPKDIPLDEYPKPEEYLSEARRLADEAQKQGLILRVMGPIALHFYFPEYVDLYRSMERLGERVFTDIDYASYGKNRGKIVPFFEKQGYYFYTLFSKDAIYFLKELRIYDRILTENEINIIYKKEIKSIFRDTDIKKIFCLSFG